MQPHVHDTAQGHEAKQAHAPAEHKKPERLHEIFRAVIGLNANAA